MNVVLRKITSIMTAITIVYTSSITPIIAAPTTFSITIDGHSAPVHYIIQDDRLLVPAIFFRKLGVKVYWNEAQQAVVLVGANKRMALPAENKKTYTSVGNSERWTEKTTITTTVHHANNTYVPLRHVAENLGISLTYQPAASTISLNTNGRAAKQQADKNDLYWLYQITEAEAGGESSQGKVAVAAVILNRVDSPDWPNTIRSVIFDVDQVNGIDYYQFSPVLDGRIYEVEPSQATIDAVNDALNGTDPTNGALVFYNPDKTDNKWVRSRPVSTTIGNHIFAY